ncbi:MAG: hypothetical protein ACRD98_11685, partial [Nitrososphaera sp.]
FSTIALTVFSGTTLNCAVFEAQRVSSARFAAMGRLLRSYPKQFVHLELFVLVGFAGVGV